MRTKTIGEKKMATKFGKWKADGQVVASQLSRAEKDAGLAVGKNQGAVGLTWHDPQRNRGGRGQQAGIKSGVSSKFAGGAVGPCALPTGRLQGCTLVASLGVSGRGTPRPGSWGARHEGRGLRRKPTTESWGLRLSFLTQLSQGWNPGTCPGAMWE